MDDSTVVNNAALSSASSFLKPLPVVFDSSTKVVSVTNGTECGWEGGGAWCCCCLAASICLSISLLRANAIFMRALLSAWASHCHMAQAKQPKKPNMSPPTTILAMPSGHRVLVRHALAKLSSSSSVVLDVDPFVSLTVRSAKASSLSLETGRASVWRKSRKNSRAKEWCIMFRTRPPTFPINDHAHTKWELPYNNNNNNNYYYYHYHYYYITHL